MVKKEKSLNFGRRDYFLKKSVHQHFQNMKKYLLLSSTVQDSCSILKKVKPI